MSVKLGIGVDIGILMPVLCSKIKNWKLTSKKDNITLCIIIYIEININP